jgi:hypothetical protein
MLLVAAICPLTIQLWQLPKTTSTTSAVYGLAEAIFTYATYTSASTAVILFPETN